MYLDELVKSTVKDSKEIEKEYHIFRNFQESNPWIMGAAITKLESEGKEVPSFESLIAFKDHFFIDDYSKIHKQLRMRDPYLRSSGPAFIYYYSIEKGLHKKQLEDGLELGDNDANNRLVSGSNLVLNNVELDIEQFLEVYYTKCN